MVNKSFIKPGVWLILILSGFAGTGYSQTNDLNFISWALYGPPNHLEVSGNYLYASANAFVIVDISDETNPKIISHLRPLETGEAGSFVINGNYAYVFWVGQGLRIIDIRDKSNPFIVSTYSTNLYGNSEIHLSYPFLFAIAEEIVQGSVEYHFQIFNVSNPDSITITGDFDLANIGIHSGQRAPRFPHEFIIDENNIYLLSAPPVQFAGEKIVKLHVLDISSPDSIFHQIGRASCRERV